MLFVSSRYPGDVRTAVHGVFLRMRIILESIAAAGYELRILFLTPPDADCSAGACIRLQEELVAAWGVAAQVRLVPMRGAPVAPGVFSFYVHPALDPLSHAEYYPTCGQDQVGALASALRERPAAVFVHRLDAMGTLLRGGLAKPGMKVLFDIDDLEHKKEQRTLASRPRGWKKALGLLYARALARLVSRSIRASDATFVCSDADRAELVAWLGASNVFVVPNAIAAPLTQMEPSQNPAVGFVGSFTYEPNVVAVERLIGEVWPIVRGLVPSARLIIAGQKPERVPSFARHSPAVEFTGFVKEISDFYQRVTVVCCPIVSGGGTRLKIIEAAAFGRPVVATRIAAEGLAFEQDTEILLAESSAELASNCARLLSDSTLYQSVASSARKRYSGNYDRSCVVRECGAMIRSIVG